MSNLVKVKAINNKKLSVRELLFLAVLYRNELLDYYLSFFIIEILENIYLSKKQLDS